MSLLAIRTERLSKQYFIGSQPARYQTLREVAVARLQAPFRRAGRLLRGRATGAAELNEAIWALKDVSFEINHGEVVGIIGRNGAGKSTLLKILSRITEPTQGRVRIRGRVGSLLEVGTGFHHELTGRENVFLNGAILGMRKAEIERKFDEIVAFAEVERFIDTPVKHYSSGMQVRLAFAVAAHLEPEILLVDEVLAVGDAQFQRKCLNKMQDVGQAGRTVLFVSHNMSTVTRLCQRAILLQEGQVMDDGHAHDVVANYMLDGSNTTAERVWPDPAVAPGGEIARLRSVRVKSDAGEVAATVDIRRPLTVEMEFEALQSGYVLLPHFHFFTDQGVTAFAAVDLDPEWRRKPRPAGHYVTTARVPGNLLAEGMLFVMASLVTLSPTILQFSVPDAVAFQVVDSMEADSARGDWAGRLSGVMRPRLEWQTKYSRNGERSVDANRASSPYEEDRR